MKLRDFQVEVAEALVKSGKGKVRGRPSSIISPQPVPKKKRVEPLPGNDVRIDGFDMLMELMNFILNINGFMKRKLKLKLIGGGGDCRKGKCINNNNNYKWLRNGLQMLCVWVPNWVQNPRLLADLEKVSFHQFPLQERDLLRI
ncbi:hypothetical protein GQR58_013967 [Nymphon striatum]|nr:hypothetical protein GQR58_013967 [Nymphon striatum]